MTSKRTVFFVSDRTGITAETLGHSLLTQFEVDFHHVTMPFIDSPERVQAALGRIAEANRISGERSLVFSTVVDTEVRETLRGADAVVIDFFETFIAPLERELDIPSVHVVGHSHGVVDDSMYDVRIDAMNYALNHDDGVTTHHYSQADVILVGVSRSGKTPACIYLALQYGVYAANYPLTEDDLEHLSLPKVLEPYRDKLFGLTIRPDRLQQIRDQRRPNSRYASPRQVNFEVARAEAMFRRERIPSVNTTTMSIEEISTRILLERNLQRRLY